MKKILLASAMALGLAGLSGYAYADVAASSATAGSFAASAAAGVLTTSAASAGGGASNFSSANYFGATSVSHTGGGSSSGYSDWFWNWREHRRPIRQRPRLLRELTERDRGGW